MTHITQEQALGMAKGNYSKTEFESGAVHECYEFSEAELHALCNAAIQHYITEQAKSLPELPTTDKLALTNAGVVCWHSPEVIQAYVLQCRVAALEEAAESLFGLDVESYGILPIRASMVISDCNMQIQKLKEGK